MKKSYLFTIISIILILWGFAIYGIKEHISSEFDSIRQKQAHTQQEIQRIDSSLKDLKYEIAIAEKVHLNDVPSDWETYRNDELSFAFKHPPEYCVVSSKEKQARKYRGKYRFSFYLVKKDREHCPHPGGPGGMYYYLLSLQIFNKDKDTPPLPPNPKEKIINFPNITIDGIEASRKISNGIPYYSIGFYREGDTFYSIFTHICKFEGIGDKCPDPEGFYGRHGGIIKRDQSLMDLVNKISKTVHFY